MFKAIFVGAVVLVVGFCSAHAATIYVPDNYTTIWNGSPASS